MIGEFTTYRRHSWLLIATKIFSIWLAPCVIKPPEKNAIFVYTMRKLTRSNSRCKCNNQINNSQEIRLVLHGHLHFSSHQNHHPVNIEKLRRYLCRTKYWIKRICSFTFSFLPPVPSRICWRYLASLAFSRPKWYSVATRHRQLRRWRNSTSKTYLCFSASWQSPSRCRWSSLKYPSWLKCGKARWRPRAVQISVNPVCPWFHSPLCSRVSLSCKAVTVPQRRHKNRWKKTRKQ